MALFDKQARLLARYLSRPRTHGTAGWQQQPERVRLDVQDGMAPSTKPPVCIFLGTEPVHDRAERVFIWSIQTHRDPSRIYDIYLMKDLRGFDRRGWLTGFTNYRFAIPHFTAGVGRAIYNDVDQIYLADPGELFDTAIMEHGFLALSDRDTSVMLIDCARMASVWTLPAAQHQRRQAMEARACAVPGLRGQLDPVWNARDMEYVPHRSKLLHYTAMHTQPWQPSRRRYAYQRHPFGQLWLDLEAAADAAGYQVFSASRPSAHYQARLARLPKGGRRPHGTPTVWLLTDGSPGNTTQSVGLLRALGWPYTCKELSFTAWIQLHKGLFGAFGASRLGMDKKRSAVLAPPWPDLVVATGMRASRVARWIGKRSQGRTRLIQLGRKGGQVADWYDAVVSCLFYRLPPHPRRVEIVAPLTQVTPEQLAQAQACWRGLFEAAPRPWVALLVGGTSVVYRLDATTAQRMGEEVRSWAQAKGGSVFVTTSRRTGTPATEALRRTLGTDGYLHAWQPGQQDNPYLGYLAVADVLVVTADSESMLTEAVSTGKPVYIYPLPTKPPTLGTRWREWVVARAQKPRLNKRGTVRPQQGMAYLCARLIERGFVLPPNDPHTLHQTLIQHGLARLFGEPLEVGCRPPLRALTDVASRVRALVGLDAGTEDNPMDAKGTRLYGNNDR